MEEANTKNYFKIVDKTIFERIEKFRQSPNYNGIQDFYNSLEEEQQRTFKGLVVLTIFLIPFIFVGFIMWQNTNLKDDYEIRLSILNRANEIIGQNKGMRDIGPQILSSSPIDSNSMMTSRLSSLLSSSGVDTSKIQVRDFQQTNVSDTVSRAEAEFSFNNLSTDELMNLFTSMIQREKFRIQEVSINRNAETNLLQGQFRAIHLSALSETVDGEE